VKPTYTEVLLPLSIRKKQTNLEEERPLNETGQPVSKRKNKLRRRMSINPDWANLVSLALDVILEKLIEPIDRIWFASKIGTQLQTSIINTTTNLEVIYFLC
jgi:hypothetical protein